MRVVADTNTVISGIFWQGPPRDILDAARENRIDLFTSPVLLAELEDVLCRKKFADKLAEAGSTPRELVLGYASLTHLVEPATIQPVILNDPDDDHVLACAVAANAGLIVSGDKNLLNLRQFGNIEIITAIALKKLLF